MKLDVATVRALAHRFFVTGSLQRGPYGGAPVIEFNDLHPGNIDSGKLHSKDAELISEIAGINFFYYGPPFWRLGEIQPLKALQSRSKRPTVVKRIIGEYPERSLSTDDTFYRVRKGLSDPAARTQYDSPPPGMSGAGRLDLPRHPVLYGSSDLEVCIHEVRISAEDLAYVATLRPNRRLRMLDLTSVLEEDVTPFDSLDLAVHLVFLAGEYSYQITRSIAMAARKAGFDGILFPSYFSLLRTGAPFLETAYGIPTRRFPGANLRESEKVVPNIAIFGRPVSDGRLTVKCMDRLYIRRVAYDLGFGPVDP